MPDRLRVNAVFFHLVANLSALRCGLALLSELLPLFAAFLRELRGLPLELRGLSAQHIEIVRGLRFFRIAGHEHFWRPRFAVIAFKVRVVERGLNSRIKRTLKFPVLFPFDPESLKLPWRQAPELNGRNPYTGSTCSEGPLSEPEGFVVSGGF